MRLLANGVRHSQLLESREHVGTHLDPVTNRSDLLALLQEADRYPLLTKRQRSGKTAQSSADDQNLIGILVHPGSHVGLLVLLAATAHSMPQDVFVTSARARSRPGRVV